MKVVLVRLAGEFTLARQAEFPKGSEVIAYYQITVTDIHRAYPAYDVLVKIPDGAENQAL